jgi:peptidoglycan/LPS O-acetylase OafA/YrhL
MSALSPLPYFACMAVLVMVAGVIDRRWPFFARLRPAAGQRYSVPLEGLRGVLAPSVFLYHGALTHVFFELGHLGDVTRFYEHCGASAVLLFFFLTGYLFWSKLLRGNALKPHEFLTNRAWRIGPAYYLSVTIVVLICAFRSHFHLAESAPRVASEVFRWCTFGFLGFPDINGEPRTILTNAGVYWTLEWEWVFYFVLPWLTWFARGWRVSLVAALLLAEWGASMALGRAGGLAQIFLTGFYPGMLTAHLVGTRFAPWLRSQRWAGVIPVIALTGAVLLPPKSPQSILLLVTAFATIAAGVDVFGLLRTRGLVLLGRVSYSTYILHGSVLFVATRLLNRYVGIVGMAPIAYWACIALVGVVVVLVSAVSYQFVEHPFLPGVRSAGTRTPVAVAPERQPLPQDA